jgi:hypothetical protein
MKRLTLARLLELGDELSTKERGVIEDVPRPARGPPRLSP